MAKEVNTISLRAYAAKLNIDHKSISKAIELGKIKKGVVYIPKSVKGKVVQVPQIIEHIADKEYGNSKKVVKQQAGVSKAKVAEKLKKSVTPNPVKKVAGKNASPQEVEKDDEELIDLNNLSYEELLQAIPIHNKLPYDQVLLRRELLGLAMDKMKTQKEIGLLVEKAVIDKALFEMGNRLKTNLQNIPSRVVGLIRTSVNDVDGINILTMEINQVLEGLATL